MTRISLAQAKRLGIQISSTQKKEGKPGKGRNRFAKDAFQGAPLEFTIPLASDPKPKKRPRTVTDTSAIKSAFLAARGNLTVFMEMIGKRSSRTYTPEETIAYEETLRQAARVAMLKREIFTCPIETHITFVLAGDPNTWPTSPRDGDADNLEKAVFDAFNGIVFDDDRLVVRSFREKICGHSPEIRVKISPAG